MRSLLFLTLVQCAPHLLLTFINVLPRLCLHLNYGYYLSWPSLCLKMCFVNWKAQWQGCTVRHKDLPSVFYSPNGHSIGAPSWCPNMGSKHEAFVYFFSCLPHDISKNLYSKLSSWNSVSLISSSSRDASMARGSLIHCITMPNSWLPHCNRNFGSFCSW